MRASIQSRPASSASEQDARDAVLRNSALCNLNLGRLSQLMADLELTDAPLDSEAWPAVVTPARPKRVTRIALGLEFRIYYSRQAAITVSPTESAIR